MLFKDVIGQQGVSHQLTEMVQQNRLSHALLFLGKEGVGALPLAMAFVVRQVSLYTLIYIFHTLLFQKRLAKNQNPRII
jgi:hypothetical protein